MLMSPHLASEHPRIAWCLTLTAHVGLLRLPSSMRPPLSHYEESRSLALERTLSVCEGVTQKVSLEHKAGRMTGLRA